MLSIRLHDNQLGYRLKVGKNGHIGQMGHIGHMVSEVGGLSRVVEVFKDFGHIGQMVSVVGDFPSVAEVFKGFGQMGHIGQMVFAALSLPTGDKPFNALMSHEVIRKFT
jgi:hypothetical protein